MSMNTYVIGTIKLKPEYSNLIPDLLRVVEDSEKFEYPQEESWWMHLVTKYPILKEYAEQERPDDIPFRGYGNDTPSNNWFPSTNIWEFQCVINAHYKNDNLSHFFNLLSKIAAIPTCILERYEEIQEWQTWKLDSGGYMVKVSVMKDEDDLFWN